MVAEPLPQMLAFDNSKLYVWVKGLESKVNNLLREIDVLKNDFMRKNNDLKKEIKTLNDDLMEVKHEWEKTIQKMDLIIKELKQTAGKEEVMVLKKYLDLWNPLHFATQRDVEQLIDAKLALLKSARTGTHSLESDHRKEVRHSQDNHYDSQSHYHSDHQQNHNGTHHKKAKTKHK